MPCNPQRASTPTKTDWRGITHVADCPLAGLAGDYRCDGECLGKSTPRSVEVVHCRKCGYLTRPGTCEWCRTQNPSSR